MESNKPGGAASKQDAIALLTEDHKKVQKLFKDFEKLKGSESYDEKSAIVETVCLELTVHAQIEEEIFYPAVREAIDDDDMMNEAEVEHGSAKDMISQLESMSSDDEMYDATFTVLGEYINHHIEEELNEIFPKARKAKIDLAAIGAELQQRKDELQSETESSEAAQPPAARKSPAAKSAGSKK